VPYIKSTVKAKTHRLINSRYPTIGVFDEYADSEEELRIAFELKQATNPRLTPALGALSYLPEDALLTGPTASIGMAAFIHTHETGARFNDGRLGAWYAALNIETAIAETLYHNERRLRASENGFPNRIQLRELIVNIYTELVDLRDSEETKPELFDLDDYAASQTYANSIRWPFSEANEDGLIFNSIRHVTGQNICIFRPQALPLPILQGDHYQYEWNVAGKVTVVKMIGIP